jgi:hypothetical protein
MVHRKPVREIESRLTDGGAKLLTEFESLANVGVESPKQVVCIHFKEKDRYGFYMQSGKKLKSFSVPTAFIDKSRVLSEQVLNHIKESGLYFEEGENSSIKVPVLARTTSTALKNFQGSQYPVVSSYVRYFSETFSEEQRKLLSRWFLQESFYEEGLTRLDLELNTDTDYFREKAAKLATLMGGGTWFFKELNYYESGAKCTLGHDIKWEFVAEEEATGEILKFGVDCVQDFFNVEGQVQNQLVRFRTRHFNKMLTYAYSYSQQLGYQKNFGLALPSFWQSLVDGGFAKSTSKIEYLLKFVSEFNRLNMPLPVSLRLQFLKELEQQRAHNLRYRFMENTFGAVSLYNMYSLLGDLVPYISERDKDKGAWSSVKGSIVSEHGLLLPEKDLVLNFMEHGFFVGVSNLYATLETYGDLVRGVLANSTSELDFQRTCNKLSWFSSIQNRRSGEEVPHLIGGIVQHKYSSPSVFGLGSAGLIEKGGKLEVDFSNIDRFYEGVLNLTVSLEDLMSVYNLFVKKLEEQRAKS